MEELIARFRENGLTHEQIDRTVSLISRWLEDHYPVAGVVVDTWVKNELSLMEEK